MVTGYGIKVKGQQDRTMIDRHGLLQTWVDSVADNLDGSYPLYLRFYLPKETMSVAELRLSFQTERFRSYTTGTIERQAETLPEENTHSHNFNVDSLGSCTLEREEQNWETGTGDSGENHRHSYTQEWLVETHRTSGWVTGHGVDISSDADGDHNHGTIPHDHGLIFGINLHGSNPGSIDIEIQLPDSSWQNVSYSNPDDIDLLPYLDQENLKGWYTLKLSTDRLSRVTTSYMIQTLTAVDLTGEEQ